MRAPPRALTGRGGEDAHDEQRGGAGLQAAAGLAAGQEGLGAANEGRPADSQMDLQSLLPHLDGQPHPGALKGGGKPPAPKALVQLRDAAGRRRRRRVGLRHRGLHPCRCFPAPTQPAILTLQEDGGLGARGKVRRGACAKVPGGCLLSGKEWSKTERCVERSEIEGRRRRSAAGPAIWRLCCINSWLTQSARDAHLLQHELAICHFDMHCCTRSLPPLLTPPLSLRRCRHRCLSMPLSKKSSGTRSASCSRSSR